MQTHDTLERLANGFKLGLIIYPASPIETARSLAEEDVSQPKQPPAASAAVGRSAD